MRLFVSALLLFALAGCQSNGGSEGTTQDSTPASQAQPAGDVLAGKVTETMDAGGYTYVQVDTGSQKIWAAGPQQDMAVGTEVEISTQMPMQNFRSETLERSFDTLYFVNTFHAGGAGGMASGGNPHAGMGGMASKAAPEDMDFGGLEPADQTVAAVYDDKTDLEGQPVRVRGKVVKALSGIMGTNWLHIQDGTGEAGANDLTVTTDTTVPVGSTVVVEGNLSVDRDFGSGYRYAVIIEDAKVTVE